jgi:hypothetical protein
MNATQTQRLFLVIDRSDGGHWTLSLSRDAARFVGIYARVPGIGGADGLLRFTPCQDR